MVVIGLTGGICSGKSTVSGFLADLGAVTLNADEIGHDVFRPRTAVWEQVVGAFGRQILKDGEEIDRQKLGEIVFGDARALAQLNQIMHPAMHRVAEERIRKLKEQGIEVIVLEAPLLVEANWLDLADRVWVTVASEATVVNRCSSRSGLSEAEARARIGFQLSTEERMRYADVVINTDAAFDAVRATVKGLWDELHATRRASDVIRQALSQRRKRACEPGKLVPAAVLIPIYEKGDKGYLVVTKRTDTVYHHKGQISFPGGARHPEDGTLRDTALRESWEEIGLKPTDVEILGELDDTATHTSNFVISPFVGLIPYPYEFRPSPQEVEEVISVPLEVLLDKGNFREDTQVIEGSVVPQYYYHYGDRVIWGATARILKQLLDVAFGT